MDAFVFTLVIVSHNNPVALTLALESVLNQSYPDFQVLVINNGSPHCYDDLKQHYPQVVFRTLRSRFGLAAAFHYGSVYAKSEWVLLLDECAELLPSALDTIVDAIARHRQTQAAYPLYAFAEKGASLREQEGLLSLEDGLRFNHGFLPVLHKPTALTANFTYPHLPIDCLQLFWLQAIAKHEVPYFNQPVFKGHRPPGYQQHLTQPHQAADYAQARTWLLAEHAERLLQHPEEYHRHCLSLSWFQLLAGQRSEARKTLVKALQQKFSVRGSILLCLSCLPTFLIKRLCLSIYRWRRYSRLH